MNLLKKYLDIGGPQPVKWILRCGVLDILPAILNWTSLHEASVAVFLLQRLMLSESGPQILVRHLETMHKPPIHLLSDFASQYIPEDRINLRPDTVAGILYLYSKAILDTTWVLPDEVVAQFQLILTRVLTAEDNLVRAWGCFALATSAPFSKEIQRRVRALAVVDAVQSVRTAASFAIWRWRVPSIDLACKIPTLVEDDEQLVHHISQTCQDASYLVRTFAFALAMELASFHRPEIVKYIAQRVADDIDGREEDIPRHSFFEPIVSTFRTGCRDPLQFLQRSVQDFLAHLLMEKGAPDVNQWKRVFPDIAAKAGRESRGIIQTSDSTVSLSSFRDRLSL